jgi:hypothetical protein
MNSMNEVIPRKPKTEEEKYEEGISNTNSTVVMLSAWRLQDHVVLKILADTAQSLYC